MKIDVFQRVKALMEMNKISYRTMATDIGMSYMGFYKAVHNKSLSVEHLVKVADILGVSMAELFDEKPSGIPGADSSLQKIQILKMQDNARDIERIAAQLQRDLSKLK